MSRHAASARSDDGRTVRRFRFDGRLAAAAAILSLAGAALAADRPLGPELGNVEVRAEIQPGPQGDDIDLFAGNVARGERISAEIVVPRSSGLYPRLELLGPDGSPVAIDLVSRHFGRMLRLREFTVPETGRWTIRVGSEFGTIGEYALRIRVRAALPAVVEAPDGASGPVDLPFDALAGSRLELRATAAPASSARLVSVTDPSGAEVPGASGPLAAEAKVKGRKIAVGVDALPGADGTYVAHFALDGSQRDFSAVATVTSPPRIRGSRRLRATEPYMAPIPTPFRSTNERSIRIQGRYFASDRAPTVLFGDVPGSVVTVEPYGNYIDVLPPELPEGSVVRIAVVNPDGQSFERPDAFYYVPAPVFDDLVDAATGARVVGSRPEGGRLVRVFGRNFQTGIWLRFGASDDVLPLVKNDGELLATVPAQPVGPADVKIYDAYFHEIAAPFTFEYKDPPTIDAAPYTPSQPTSDGFSWVSMSGTGFSAGDAVRFDGALTESLLVTPSILQFRVPATSPGAHQVTVTDRVGTVVAAPQITTR